MKAGMPDSSRKEDGGKLNKNKKDAALPVVLANQVQTTVRIFSLLSAN